MRVDLHSVASIVVVHRRRSAVAAVVARPSASSMLLRHVWVLLVERNRLHRGTTELRWCVSGTERRVLLLDLNDLQFSVPSEHRLRRTRRSRYCYGDRHMFWLRLFEVSIPVASRARRWRVLFVRERRYHSSMPPTKRSVGESNGRGESE